MERGCVPASHDLCIISVLRWLCLSTDILDFAALSLCSLCCSVPWGGRAQSRALSFPDVTDGSHLSEPLCWCLDLCSGVPTTPPRWCTAFLSPASPGATLTLTWDIFCGHIFGFRDQKLPSSNALKCMHKEKYSVPLEVSRTFHTKYFPALVSACAWTLLFLLEQD